VLMSDKNTVKEVIVAAGGFAAVARRLGANRPETVRWWAVKNRVPPRWIPKLAAVVGKPPEFFWRLYNEDAP